MPEIDLHTHSTASDGTLTPAQLLRHAREVGLKALALTDHDTVGGLAEAQKAAVENGIEFVPGCELSVNFTKGVMHILGLYLPENPQKLLAGMKYLRDMRDSRNTRIIAKLRDLGLDVSDDELAALAGDGTPGRPHIARLLMDKGHAASIQDAFNEYLGEGGKAYLPKEKFSPEKAISLLKEEGATVVLAHPFTLNLSRNNMAATVRELASYGLDGLECIYSEHSPGQTRDFASLAKSMDLLVTGGSDFHGTVKPHIALGTGHGDLNVPYALLEALKDRRRSLGLPLPS